MQLTGGASLSTKSCACCAAKQPPWKRRYRSLFALLSGKAASGDADIARMVVFSVSKCLRTRQRKRPWRCSAYRCRMRTNKQTRKDQLPQTVTMTHPGRSTSQIGTRQGLVCPESLMNSSRSCEAGCFQASNNASPGCRWSRAQHPTQPAHLQRAKTAIPDAVEFRDSEKCCTLALTSRSVADSTGNRSSQLVSNLE